MYCGCASYTDQHVCLTHSTGVQHNLLHVLQPHRPRVWVSPNTRAEARHLYLSVTSRRSRVWFSRCADSEKLRTRTSSYVSIRWPVLVRVKSNKFRAMMQRDVILNSWLWQLVLKGALCFCCRQCNVLVPLFES